MNLEDLAKKTIDELSTQIQEKEQEQTKDEFKEVSQDEYAKQDLDTVQDENTPEELNFNPYEQEFQLTKVDEEQVPKVDCDEVDEKNITFKDELFLKNIRERILVLFEGLNSIDKDDLENRLDLTTNFLEFLLANIEDKLKK
ncbi:2-oxoglutarate:acceptor oxidoreductase [uncultured Campylobacter sp.]|uniref:CiaD-like domain-containing protein n=1 Tax=uncultured Campylobacter sp. TaxID=218934 RepID=UPI002606B298|nr:2-oxoglutarate:acceptor oxidoreductase [uncultured Campylobacter sp.]